MGDVMYQKKAVTLDVVHKLTERLENDIFGEYMFGK